MRSKFRLELDVVIDLEAAPSVIEAARQHYAAEGAVATVDQHAADRPLSAEEFIDEIEAALMELSEHNPFASQCERRGRTCGLQVSSAVQRASTPHRAEG